MLVREVMSTVVTFASPRSTVGDIARSMRDLGVSAVPVSTGGTVIGVVTDRDIAVRAVADQQHPRACSVYRIMSPELTTVREDDPVDLAAKSIALRDAAYALVVDDQGNFVGEIGLASALRHMADSRV